ncbi:hypothetical protein yaldo0001_20750 [Yersinia aldovae ATCC 35236]|nr:hypothetical protein yaldo0001_20750 [Yersinia aldovae ATCC 35236]
MMKFQTADISRYLPITRTDLTQCGFYCIKQIVSINNCLKA